MFVTGLLSQWQGKGDTTSVSAFAGVGSRYWIVYLLAEGVLERGADLGVLVSRKILGCSTVCGPCELGWILGLELLPDLGLTWYC